MFLVVACVARPAAPSASAGSDVYDSILGPCVYREATALKDPQRAVERTPAALSLFAPERRKMPVRLSRRKDEGSSFQGPQFDVGDPFPLLHLLIRQLWKDGEHCNRAVEVDCSPGFTAASIKNGVIA